MPLLDQTSLAKSGTAAGPGPHAKIALILFAFALVCAAAWIAALNQANSSPDRRESKTLYGTTTGDESFMVVVEGGSMVPTIFPTSAVAHCNRCQHRFRVRRETTATDCYQCGDVCELLPGRVAPDKLVCLPIPRLNDLRPGDLVLLKQPDNSPAQHPPDNSQRSLPIAVKRILAVPGDVVSVDPASVSGLELLVNNAPPRLKPRFSSTLPAEIPVDRGASSDDDSKYKRWTEIGGKLVYDGLGASPRTGSMINDNIPFNTGISRPLYPIRQILLRGKITNLIIHSHPQSLTIRSNLSGDIRESQLVPLNSGEFTYDSALASSIQTPSTQPAPAVLSMELDRGQTLTQWEVASRISYRLRRLDDRKVYPLTIPPAHYYLVGDNVPLSIDSRNHGPIPNQNVLAQVKAILSSDEPRDHAAKP